MSKQKISILLVLAIFLTFSPVFYGESATQASIDREIKKKSQTIENLESKIASYERLIEEKQKEAQNLENQITITEKEIIKKEVEIQLTLEEISEKQLAIEKTRTEIQEKQTQIDKQKEVLERFIRIIYEHDQESTLEIVLKNETFSDFLNQQEYTKEVENETKKTLDEIQELERQLMQKEGELTLEKQELTTLKNHLESQKQELTEQKKSKEMLLAKTRMQEEEYKKIVQNINKQKSLLLGDIDDLLVKKQDELAKIRARQKTPTSNRASTSWYYSQKDPRWAYDTIGWSNSLMKNYGCAVTSIAMVFKYYGINITPGELAKKPIFYNDLIVWPSQWAFLKLVSNTYHRGVSWSQIDKEIAQGHPVIVFVKANGIGAGHYVVITGKDNTGHYIVHDPIWGPNIYLDTTRAYIGAIYNTTTAIDQAIIYHPY